MLCTIPIPSRIASSGIRSTAPAWANLAFIRLNFQTTRYSSISLARAVSPAGVNLPGLAQGVMSLFATTLPNRFVISVIPVDSRTTHHTKVILRNAVTVDELINGRFSFNGRLAGYDISHGLQPAST